MITREQLIKFIPQPKNEDVIIYDVSLKDLIDTNVVEEYNKTLPIFLNKKEEYLLLKAELEEKGNAINNIYLFNTSWSEEDYLYKLKNDKKTYNTLYNDIKKIENSIEMLNKKIKIMNDKIQMQIARENRLMEERKGNLYENMQKNRNNLMQLRDKLSFYKEMLLITNKKIEENEDEFKILYDMQENLKNGNYKCKYCGSTVKVYSENSLIYKRLTKNVEDNKKDLENFLKKKNELELNVAFYESEISKIKTELSNDIEFKKQDCNFYTKKSIQVLKLEALRDELINNVSEKEKELKTKPSVKSDKYLKLKDDINKCELSLSNLQKLRTIKSEINEISEKYKKAKEEVLALHKTIQKYIDFLIIYYKIYEQKANDFFGKDYKFKFFKFKDYIFKPVFELQYKGIDYFELDKNDKKEVDFALSSKVSFFD